MQQPALIHNGWKVRSLCLAMSILLVAGHTRAENNTDYIYNGTTNNVVGSLLVPASSSGTNNSLQILSNGLVTTTVHTVIGEGVSASNNFAIVNGTGSALQVGNSLFVGNAGSYNRLSITNGGDVIVSGDVFTGNAASAIGNQMFVDGSGSVLIATNAGKFFFVGVTTTSNQATVSNGGLINVRDIRVGHVGSGNLFTITSGGRLESLNVIRVGHAGDFNTLLITGSNSYARAGVSLDVGFSGRDNQMIISNGGRLDAASAFLGQGTAASNVLVTITGSGSIMSNSTETVVGFSSPNTRLVISNGGRVDTGVGAGTTIAKVGYGGLLVDGNSSALVTGAGSVWNADVMFVGQFFSTGNSLVISNGGNVNLVGRMAVGVNPAASNNNVVVTGSGSLLKVGTLTSVGNNGGFSQGSNSFLRVTDGATLECNDLRGGTTASHGAIRNVGGIYQFTIASPSVSGAVTIDGGTISYRNVANADINNAQVGNITKQGNNTFQLNNSTNVSLASYTFNTGNPSNYYRLSLQNGGRFQATTTTFGSGGSLVGNGTVASANVTNHGTIAPGFSAGEITFTSNLVLGSSSVLAMEIGGTNAADYDRLIVLGSATLTGSLVISPINSFSTTPGDTFTLIDANALSGQFTSLTNNQFIDASQNGMNAYFRIQYNAGLDGNDVILLATIPEPSTVLMLGIAAVLLLRRRE